MKSLRKAIIFSILLFILCGGIYPLLLTGLSQTIFPRQANGSMIEYKGKVIGSELIGQQFTSNQFFKGRVSAVQYNMDVKQVSSGSQNLAPSNPELKLRIAADVNRFLADNPTIRASQIPIDLVTSSASGLDPDISVQAALVQVPSIAKATGISESKLTSLVNENTTQRDLGILGEKRVNVLKLNVEVLKLIK